MGIDAKTAHSYIDLLSHMALGASWEDFVIENLFSCAPQMVQGHFYRSSCGAEIDLLLTRPNGTMWAIEIKRSLRGPVTHTRKLVVYPGIESFPLGNDVLAVSLIALCAELSLAGRT